MQLRCVRAFGNFQPDRKDEDGNAVPADVVEVEDGAVFDTAYFEPVKKKAPAVAKEEGN